MTDEHCQSDAAYVLGALPPAERREFEAHLADCAECQRSVRELAGLPGLMATVRPEDFDAPALPPPATLLPSLVRAVRHERTRRRWTGVAIAAAAAAAVAVTTIGVDHLSVPTSQSAAGVAMRAVGDEPIHATARLTGKAWGTQIDLVCTYDRSSAYARPGAQTYRLLVTNHAGVTQQVATWKVVPNGASTVSGSVGWQRADIAKVEIEASDGAPVLRLRV
jgi:hypothetical protein